MKRYYKKKITPKDLSPKDSICRVTYNGIDLGYTFPTTRIEMSDDQGIATINYTEPNETEKLNILQKLNYLVDNIDLEIKRDYPSGLYSIYVGLGRTIRSNSFKKAINEAYDVYKNNKLINLI